MVRAHVDELYTAYLEGSLLDAVRQEMDAHLRACPRCQGELEAMRQVVTCLQDLPPLAVPPHFVESVRARLPKPRPSLFAWRAPALAGGLLVAAAAMLLIMVRMNPVPGSPQAGVTPSTMTTHGEGTPNALPQQIAARPRGVPALPETASRGMGRVPDPFANDDANLPVPRARDKAQDNWHPGLSNGAQPVPPVTSATSEDRATIVFNPPTANKSAAQPVPTNGTLLADAGKPAPAPTAPLSETYAGTTAGVTAKPSATPPPAMASPQVGPAGPVGRIGIAPSIAADAVKAAPTPPSLTIAKAGPPDNDGARGGSADMLGTPQQRSYRNAVPGGSLLAPAPDGQRLPFGQLAAEATQLPDGASVLLRMSGTAPVTLAATVVRPAGGEKQQLTFPAQSREIQLKFPKLPESSAVKLELRSRNMTETLYLIVPGDNARVDTVRMSLKRAPVLPELLLLANDAGAFILCPASFAERAVTFTAALPPTDALNALARQYHYTTTFSNNLLNITTQ
ncbi:MAG TPA: zf-HC2 domain-containing protein [Armatimonadota bacterium]|jgi:hypothetical protein